MTTMASNNVGRVMRRSEVIRRFVAHGFTESYVVRKLLLGGILPRVIPPGCKRAFWREVDVERVLREAGVAQGRQVDG